MSDATTYAPEIKDLGEKIVSLTLGKAVELADYLEKVHNIKPAAGGAVVMAAPGAAAGAEAAPAKTEFTVVLDGIIAADKKISIIKVVREITGLGLKEAKDLVEGAPKNVKENIAKDEAETVKKKLEDAGAKVSLK
ncbi:MAG: 50S ribosomal protein L7/L12 [Planctomycetaceae bacterium]|nr:50S ribosomal protein L7/L12 [Gemmataceae bacterium]PHX63957.1 MAG: 50S ribosomal protein L7/L12 [Planctomycetaceae bacterium]